MKLVRNTSRRPLRVPLSGGKVLHLGPAATGQVSDDSVERPGFRKLVESGDLEIVGQGQGHGETPGPAAPTPRESTQGHHAPTMVMPKGNR